MSTDTADIFRALVVIEAVFAAATSVYAITLWHRRQAVEHYAAGLFPVHVWGLFASLILLIGYGAADMVSRLGNEPTWRIPYLAVVFIVVNVGQAALVSIQAHKSDVAGLGNRQVKDRE